MTDPTTPVDRLRAEITERLERAWAMAEPSDAIPISVWEDGFGRIRRSLESEIARSCERDLRVLNRHAPRRYVELWPTMVGLPPPDPDRPRCWVCHTDAPCLELTDLADEYGVDLTGGTP